ncbi:MAG: aldo/keto reductase [Phycisphaerae bacterium]|nr:aldo/keto reductase [Phycisphaerae bacterium]
MQTRILGRTGAEVARLGFGAMELRGRRIWNGRPVTNRQAETILNAVLDSGIDVIDTSYDYGESEEAIGMFIASRRREYYLATKCGCTVVYRGAHDETPHIWTKSNLLHNLETSLKRLKTDCIDIWQLHNPTVDDVEHNNLLEVMDRARSQGKVRWLGISTTLPEIETFLTWDCFDVFQIPYSAFQMEHDEAISKAAHAGCGTLIRGALAQGQPGISYRGQRQRWLPWHKANLDELRSPNETPTQFLLRFALAHPDIHTLLVGTLNPDHLAEDLKAVEEGPLFQDVYREVKRRLEEVAHGVSRV